MKMPYLLVITLVTLGLIACAQVIPPESRSDGTTPSLGKAPSSSVPAAAPTSTLTPTGWQQKWDAVLVAGKKEGVVRIYTVWTPEVSRPMREVFFNKYGIELEFTSLDRAASLLPKIQAEQRSGLYIPDIFGIGTNTLVSDEKANGMLGPIEPLFILPEITDLKVWRNGQFPYMDRDKLVVGFTAGIERYILYNTTAVKNGEITSYKDLLKPQYKEKIVMTDPSMAGGANSVFAYLADDRIWGLDTASQWLRTLMVQQETSVQSNERLATEWVARGKYPLGVAPHPASTTEFIRAGAPIDLAVPIEGQPTTAAGGGIAIPKKSEHPNAQTIFVNWLLTREGQTVFSQGYGRTSARIDVPTDFIPPTYIPGPTEKGFPKTEEYLIHEEKMRAVARKILVDAGVGR